MPRFKLEPVDETFLSTAPKRYVEALEIARPAQQVWEELVADDAFSWCRLLGGTKWSSPRPFGIGTTRSIKVAAGAIVLDERFFRWEEGRRNSFYVERCNLPLFRRFAEDCLVEDTSSSTSRLTWTIAADPHPAARPGNPVSAMLIRSFFEDTRKHFGAAS